jgi:hypothetical protein
LLQTLTMNMEVSDNKIQNFKSSSLMYENRTMKSTENHLKSGDT